MKKIILATAAVLFASGMAFAGSDHYGADFVPGSSSYPAGGHHAMSNGAKTVDPTVTNSIGTGGNSVQESGRGIWGR